MDGWAESDPLERLRFFCSLAITGQDWIDIEQFFNDLKARDERVAAEIGVLKIAHEAHQTSNLKMLAVLKKQNAEIEKYKALCDQMGDALLVSDSDFPMHIRQVKSALEAWSALK